MRAFQALLFTASLVLLLNNAFAQQGRVFGGFMDVYPIGDNPSVAWKSSMVDEETIIFEGNPIVRYSFYNDFIDKLSSDKDYAKAYFLSYRPQLRMYQGESLPILTPSYRVLLGTQQLWRMKDDDFLAFSFETGHFSNGQTGCAFADTLDDGTPECAAIYDQIHSDSDLSELLNRKNGDFSTNTTELIVKYQLVTHLDENDRPDEYHAFQVGTLLYHKQLLGIFNIGGFSKKEIEIYGRWRFLANYEYANTISIGGNLFKFTLSEQVEVIKSAHPFVNPLRSESTIGLFHSNGFGYFFSFSFGHDNYNNRFVDSGSQFAIGMMWDKWPPFSIK